jgi:uncharacterized cupin superfamily protein
MDTKIKALHVPPDGGRERRLRANRIVFKVDVAVGAQHLGLFISSFPPGGGYPLLHVHRSYEEIFHVLEGEIEYRLDDERVRTVPGSTIFIPPGVGHCFANVGSSQARIVLVGSPPQALRMVEELTEVPFERESHARIFERHDSYLVDD